MFISFFIIKLKCRFEENNGMYFIQKLELVQFHNNAIEIRTYIR